MRWSKKLITGVLSLALGSLGFYSCVDEDYDLDNLQNGISLSLEEYLPIGRTSLTLGRLLEEIEFDGLSEDGNGELTFVYDTVSRTVINPFELKLTGDEFTYDLIDVAPGYSVGTVMDGLTGLPIPDCFFIPVNEKVELPVIINLDFDSDEFSCRIDKINIKEAVLKIKIESENLVNFANGCNLVLDIPECVEGGKPDKYTWNGETGEATLDLSGSTLNMQGKDKIELLFKAYATERWGFKIAETIEFKITAFDTDITYSSIYGAVTTSEAQNESCDMALDIFKDVNVDFNLKIVAPKLTLTAYSNSGMPLEANIQKLVSKRNDGSEVYGVFRDGSTSYTMNFERATGEKEVMAFTDVFDNENGNLSELINNRPDSLLFKCSYQLKGDVSNNISYYLMDTTYIDTRIRAEIPIWIGGGSYITMHDTIKDVNLLNDLTNYEQQDYSLNWIEVDLSFENGIPLSVTATAEFLAEDTTFAADGSYSIAYRVLDPENLTQTIDMKAAEVDEATSHAIKTTPYKTTIRVEDASLEDIKKMRKIAYTYKVYVEDDVNSVKLTTDNLISAKVSAHFKATYCRTDDKK